MDRFKVAPNGYRYDKYLFRYGVLFLVLFVLCIWGVNGFSFSHYVYTTCPGPTPCENPLVSGVCVGTLLYSCDSVKCVGEWCTWETLPPGEYGTPPPFIMKYFSLFAFFIYILLFWINHTKHNKGVPFELPFKVSKELEE